MGKVGWGLFSLVEIPSKKARSSSHTNRNNKMYRRQPFQTCASRVHSFESTAGIPLFRELISINPTDNISLDNISDYRHHIRVPLDHTVTYESNILKSEHISSLCRTILVQGRESYHWKCAKLHHSHFSNYINNHNCHCKLSSAQATLSKEAQTSGNSAAGKSVPHTKEQYHHKNPAHSSST